MNVTLLLVAANMFAANTIAPAVPEVPYRQPQLAVGHGMTAMVFGGGPSIYFASSSDNGLTFAKPVKVSEAGAVALGRHRGPRVVILKDSILVSAVVAEKVSTGTHAHGLPENGNLNVWRSTDKGRTWKPSGVVNDVPGAPREGLHAMVAGADGALFAAWLDQRTPGMKLYGSRSADGGVSWSKNIEVYRSPDGAICNCCHPSLAIEASGRIWAMWRNVLDGNRDMYAAYSDNGAAFQPVAKQGSGAWKINACPMDGGGFVVEQGRITSAWRRESDIYLAEPGVPEKKLGAGKDVAIARTKRGVYAAWTRDGGLMLRRPGEGEAQPLSASGAFVTLTPLHDGAVLAAWESNGSIETRTIN